MMMSMIIEDYAGAQLGWADVERLTDALAKDISSHNWLPDFITPVPRGGWTVAALLAQKLNVKASVAVDLILHPDHQLVSRTSGMPIPNAKVLVVEDTLETGRKAKAFKEQLRISGAADVRTAAYFILGTCQFTPDFFIGSLAENPKFPWDS